MDETQLNNEPAPIGSPASESPAVGVEPVAPVISAPEPAAPPAPVGGSENPGTNIPSAETQTAQPDNQADTSAPGIVHTVAEDAHVGANPEVPSEPAPGVVTSFGVPETPAATVETSAPSPAPNTGVSPAPSEAPARSEQPTADLSSVGVNLGNNAASETPASPAVDSAPAEVAPPSVPPAFQEGLSGVNLDPTQGAGGIGVEPRSAAAALTQADKANLAKRDEGEGSILDKLRLKLRRSNSAATLPSGSIGTTGLNGSSSSVGESAGVIPSTTDPTVPTS